MEKELLASLKILEEEEAKFLKEEELAVKFLEEEEAVARSIYLNKSSTSLEIRADFMRLQKKNEVLVKENNDLHRQVAALKDRLAELEKNKICVKEMSENLTNSLTLQRLQKENEVLVEENDDLHRQVAELKDRLAELEKNKICKEEQAQSVVYVDKIMEVVRHFEMVRNKRNMFLKQKKMLLNQKEDAS
ncbi:hypothetical protein LINPERHAP1_LOCUS16899 [Linum perenne]